LSVTVPVTFAPAFAGTAQIYMQAQDTNTNTAWEAMGTWGT
jgi:hypothetical protein